MGLKSKIKNWFFLDESYEEEYDESYETSREPEPERHRVQAQTHVQNQNFPQKQNVVSLQSVKSSSKLILVEPRVFAESQDIADHIKNRRAVVVNLQRIDNREARRIIDFLSGTVYALGGEIQKIGTHIILCAPDNVEVTGSISEMLNNQDFDDARW